MSVWEGAGGNVEPQITSQCVIYGSEPHLGPGTRSKALPVVLGFMELRQVLWRWGQVLSEAENQGVRTGRQTLLHALSLSFPTWHHPLPRTRAQRLSVKVRCKDLGVSVRNRAVPWRGGRALVGRKLTLIHIAEERVRASRMEQAGAGAQPAGDELGAVSASQRVSSWV